MHTVITGPPGVGKTEFAKALGELYLSMGILTNKKFVKVTRSDLVAKYLGQTAIKTKEKIKSCSGGVMFIDEVYSLGNRSIIPLKSLAIIFFFSISVLGFASIFTLS